MNEQMAVEKAEPAATAAKTPEWEWETGLGRVKLSVDMVRRYFCPKATEPEVMHFMAVCKYHRLNPWLREAYLIKYQETEAAQIVIGRDTHARRAEEHPQYKGDSGGIIVQTSDGKVEEREGEFFVEPDKLVGGWALVWRKDRDKPIYHRIRLQDWMQYRKDGAPSKFWKSSPAHMIAKVARAQARHEAFPTEFSGILSEDEAQAGPKSEAPIIEMPLSVAEAAEKSGGNGHTDSSAGTGEAHGETEVKGTTEAPAGEVPSEEEQEAIRSKEQAEAQPDLLKPPVKVDRGKVWEAVKVKAKKDGKSASEVLKNLTARHNMTDLTDDQVVELAKKLGV